ncbi:hypothetical protein [Budvicia aquatica]|uniref:hypothetical protein n=1 Tax=Budvicia aquatica TaxID=82979 RepID=UPI0020827D1B|nr:hypothetical protein [Budvicia aquatica]GKX52791.1 hypothetical protein SOASR029_31000 [Budvicia aquatica]
MRDNTLGLVKRLCSRVALIAAIIMGASTPGWSVVLSDPTGKIKGRAPTAAGSVSILMPGGATPLVDNAQVLGSKKPNEFSLAPLSPGITFTDLDGDTQALPGLAIAPAGVTWTWKNGGTPLTATQLTQTFATNFAHNTTLTVQADAPVLSTSLTGLPTTSGTPVLLASPVYRVRVNNPPPPVIYVNGTTFAWDSGFPTMGFVGAQFQLFMNGVNATANSNYTYTENGNQTWVDIPASNASGTEGTFTFIGTPTSANKTLQLIATNKTDSSDKYTLNITIGRWFVNGGAILRNGANADAYCTGLGDGYSTPPYATMTNAAYGTSGTRAPVAGLWNQWGSMDTFGSGWVSYIYWGLEPYGVYRYHVHLGLGHLLSNTPAHSISVACSRVL